MVGPSEIPFFLTVSINIERYPKEPPIISMCTNPSLSAEGDEEDFMKILNKIDYIGEDGVVDSNFQIFEEWEEQNFCLIHIMNEIGNEILKHIQT